MMSRKTDPVPTEDALRWLSRVCPACKGAGFLIVALGPHGESAHCVGTRVSRECGLCLSLGEITSARAIQLGLEAEGER